MWTAFPRAPSTPRIGRRDRRRLPPSRWKSVGRELAEDQVAIARGLGGADRSEEPVSKVRHLGEAARHRRQVLREPPVGVGVRAVAVDADHLEDRRAGRLRIDGGVGGGGRDVHPVRAIRAGERLHGRDRREVAAALDLPEAEGERRRHVGEHLIERRGLKEADRVDLVGIGGGRPGGARATRGRRGDLLLDEDVCPIRLARRPGAGWLAQVGDDPVRVLRERVGVERPVADRDGTADWIGEDVGVEDVVRLARAGRSANEVIRPGPSVTAWFTPLWKDQTRPCGGDRARVFGRARENLDIRLR